jgi:hypothetical protein
MNLTKLVISVLTAALLTLAVGAGPASAGGVAPQLTKFKAEDRIATGKVARYDLKEESTAFSYRIMAQYIEAKVQRLKHGEWKSVGKVKATPPKSLNFWPVFKQMGVGTYRIVARACNGTGDERQEGAGKTIRFKVVARIAHDD